MPYLDRRARERVAERGPRNVGELTYALTTVVNEYLRATVAPRFADLAEVIGALEATKHEFQRRVVDPYEDLKRSANGDVYDGTFTRE